MGGEQGEISPIYPIPIKIDGVAQIIKVSGHNHGWNSNVLALPSDFKETASTIENFLEARQGWALEAVGSDKTSEGGKVSFVFRGENPPVATHRAFLQIRPTLHTRLPEIFIGNNPIDFITYPTYPPLSDDNLNRYVQLRANQVGPFYKKEAFLEQATPPDRCILEGAYLFPFLSSSGIAPREIPNRVIFSLYLHEASGWLHQLAYERTQHIANMRKQAESLLEFADNLEDTRYPNEDHARELLKLLSDSTIPRRF